MHAYTILVDARSNTICHAPGENFTEEHPS